jgi:predicted DCC family thiol-disulfide oxidoreductase YuxK
VPDQKPILTPVLIYDGRCSFCKIWIDYWKRLTGDRVEYAASQDVADQYPQIPRAQFGKSVQLVRQDGTVASGARAVFESLDMRKTYERSRVFAWFAEQVYAFAAARRDLFYWLTRLTFGSHIEPARFDATQWVFLRVLAVIYAVAFGSLAVQIKGLIGEHGISPAGTYLTAVAQQTGSARWFILPTIFWFGTNDQMLTFICWAGVAFAVALFFGRLEKLMLVLLFGLYLSLSSAGQEFLGFQWDALLVEAGFLAIFLGRARIVDWLFRWLAFRLTFLSGAVKLLSHDFSWRNLSALDYHFHTQPLPTVFAWYADKLPRLFQHASTFLVLVIEIGVPFLIFLPRRLRHAGAWSIIALQALIFVTGNYTFFNVLTVAICLFLFDDRELARFVPRIAGLRGWVKRGQTTLSPPVNSSSSTGQPPWTERSDPFLPSLSSPREASASPFEDQPNRVQRVLVALLAGFIVMLGVGRIIETFTGDAPEPLKLLVRVSSPFEIVNSYGLFAVMTTTRPEIIVEGSLDGENWTPYVFRYKPGPLDRAPRWVQPFQPRLDWQMWFAALGNYRQNLWFVGFVVRLLEGSKDVEALLESNPFPDHPPRYIRAQTFEYSFTDFETRRKTGAWWKRQPLGLYLPPVGMKANPSETPP